MAEKKPSLEELKRRGLRRKPDDGIDREIREINLILRLASAKLERVDENMLATISDGQRDEFFSAVAELEQQEIRLGNRCPYCRSPLTADYGLCATCGREVCSRCGHKLTDVVLHRGNCTVYYQAQS